MLTKNPPTQITPRQLDVLRAIAQFQARQCYSPTIAELARHLGVSRTTAFEHIGALRKKGLLTGTRNRPRSLRLTPQASRLLEFDSNIIPDARLQSQSLPFLGRVAAGLPIEAVENTETISMRDLFGHTDDTFILQVAGDSMIDEQIYDGDYVVCRRASTADNGRLIVAVVDDDNATLKRFYREPRRVRLEPANDNYQPIFSDNCRIKAVVIGLLRKL